MYLGTGGFDAAERVSGADEVALAKAGHDWTCEFCQSNNRGDRSTCRNCGAKRDRTRIDTPIVDEKPPTATKTKKRWGVLHYLVASIGLLVFILVGRCVWGNMTSDVPGEVGELQWSHTVALERWQPITTGNWAPVSPRDEVPPVAGEGGVGGIQITSCYPKHHHYEQYQCGTKSESYSVQESCGTRQECSTVNNGNGSFSRRCHSVTKYCTKHKTRTVPQYCDRSITQQWCDYKSQAWREVDASTLNGTTTEEMQWPVVTPRGDLERTTRRGTWKVQVSFPDGDTLRTYAFQVAGEAELKSWSIGEKVIVTVENFGDVEKVRRASEAKKR